MKTYEEPSVRITKTDVRVVVDASPLSSDPDSLADDFEWGIKE